MIQNHKRGVLSQRLSCNFIYTEDSSKVRCSESLLPVSLNNSFLEFVNPDLDV